MVTEFPPIEETNGFLDASEGLGTELGIIERSPHFLARYTSTR